MDSNNNSFSWRTINNHEFFKRESFAHGVFKDRYIVIAGGLKQGRGFLRSAAMYDVRARSRISLPNLPDYGECFGVVLGEHFYVSSWQSRKVYRIDLSRRLKWELVTSEIDQNIIAVVTDGVHLYLIDCGRRGNRLYRYEPQSRTLILFSRVPYTRAHNAFATALVGKQIFVIGANISTFRSDTEECRLIGRANVQVYNTKTHLWSQGPYLPKPSSNMITCVMRKWIVVSENYYPRRRRGSHRYRYGRGPDKVEFDTKTVTLMFDTVQEAWTESDFGLSPYRKNHCLVTVGSFVVSVGGRNMENRNCSIEAISTTSLINYCNWETIKDLVLLYELVEKDRAHPIVTIEKKHKSKSRAKKIYRFIFKKKEKDEKKDDSDTKVNQVQVIHKLFTEVPVDIFRVILSYLF